MLNSCSKPEEVIVTTTPTIEGFKILKYISLITTDSYHDKHEQVLHSYGYKEEEISYLKPLEEELKKKAFEIGANAVVGVSFISDVGGGGNGISTWYRGYGTAVLIKSPEQIRLEEEQKKQKELKAAKEESEKQEALRRLSEAKKKAEENKGIFVYGAYEDIYPTLGTAKDLLLFLESLNITDGSFVNDVLPQIKEIQSSESFRSSKLSSALELLKQLTVKE